MIPACIGCYGPAFDVIPLRVGALFCTPKVERLPLCARCYLGVWRNWPVRK